MLRFLTFGFAVLLASGAWAQSLTPDGALVIGQTQLNLSDTASINTALDAKVDQADFDTLSSTVAGHTTQLADHESRLQALESGGVFVLRSTAAGNALTSAFMGTQAACDAVSPKDAGTLYACQ